MSADNGIYVLRTVRTRKTDGGRGLVKTDPYPVFRVALACAIDNFDWYEENAIYNLGAYMGDIWGRSPVFDSLDSALSYAHELETECPILEYGVSVIRTDYIFYGDF